MNVSYLIKSRNMCSFTGFYALSASGYQPKLITNKVFLLNRLLRCVCVSSDVCLGNGTLYQNVRRKSSFSRKEVRAYFPKTEGIVPARGSWAKLPKEIKQDDDDQVSQSAGELFKSVMGDIYASRSKHLVAVEGARQVADAIEFGLKIKILFLLKTLKSYPDIVLKLLEDQSSAPQIHRINHNALQQWSSLKTPPGIIGIFEKSKTAFQRPIVQQVLLPLTVVLDNVREPGNLGAILRTAAGIGCKVLLSQGCVDPWETKSLRGGNGAQFLLQMETKVNLEYLHQHIPLPELTPLDSNSDAETSGRNGIGVFLADIGTDPDDFGFPIVDYTSIDYSKFKSIVLILGGETSGLSETVKKSVNDLRSYYSDDVKIISRVKIPMTLPIDSLNVANAFGIIGYEILRQINCSRNKMSIEQ